MQKTVLITGASAGIGLALAQMLQNAYYKVYATSRSGDTAEVNNAFTTLKLDINNDESIENAARKILSENAKIDVLVCNAGNGIAGAVEDMTLDELRYQMETNFFGTTRVIQHFLPIFRKQGEGKIVITTSVAAIVPIPFQSAYSASKAAIMIFADALSLELKPYNIQICCVLPGDTKTNFTATRKIVEGAKSENSTYRKRFEKSIGKMERDEQNGMPPEKVASAIFKQIKKKKMHLRVIPGIDYKLICWAFGVLPTRVKLWVVGLLYG
ncbi:MAG: SDR family oxidoreductase [Prevotellaceae bacterium]|jgi:short-subunit dehydrogenase|nr:SDR family oxidoreductase [Prevotellaceae bacterium]